MLQLKTMSARGILFQVLSRLGTQPAPSLTGTAPNRNLSCSWGVQHKLCSP